MLKWLKKISSHFAKDGNFFLSIKELTGYKPLNEELFKLAFRHSSATHKSRGVKQNNQRLEFLGDAVLSAVVAEYLYRQYPEEGEGFLTNMRSKIVSRKHLNQLGIKMGLNKLVVKKTNRTVQAKSIYGDALEALIGALYLDRGFEACRGFIEQKILSDTVDLKVIETRIASHKGALLEWGQKNKREINFSVTGCYGESHARRFHVTLNIDGKVASTGQGTSKKKAEEDASRVAFKMIQNGTET